MPYRVNLEHNSVASSGAIPKQKSLFLQLLYGVSETLKKMVLKVLQSPPQFTNVLVH